MEAFCKICKSKTREIFKAKILNKYEVIYYYCNTCGFLQTEKPYWLQESYHESITASDTGGLLRSLYLAEITSLLIYFLFDKNGRYLDFAGGYGLFTRRMRDIGFDFYWTDKYTPNLFAQGFEYTKEMGHLELITSFESIEHFPDPLSEIETMLALSESIVFTTELLPYPVPNPHEWHYYGLHHGQHISFYSSNTLRFIADKYCLNFYTVSPLHIITKKTLYPTQLQWLLKLRRFGLFPFVKKRMKSRTVKDSIELAK